MLTIKIQVMMNHRYSKITTTGWGRIVMTLLAMATLMPSCKKYLAVRPDQTQVVPSGDQDLQAILDNVSVMNRGFPSLGQGASDDYYLTDADYNALSLAEDKTTYTWNPAGTVTLGTYSGPYQTVYYANQVLESLGEIPQGDPEQAQELKGASLFFRGYAFLEIAGAFGQPYRQQTADQDAGIALRLTADFNQRSVRANNRQTYSQILSDLQASVSLLPQVVTFPTRPGRAAAYGALARAALIMGSYADAGRYADSCLSLQVQLLDYKTLSASAASPFPRFNKETIFLATSLGVSALAPSKAKVDSLLYRSYAAGDLRKTLFFKNNNNGSYAFKGNYDGTQSSPIFSGLATDEIYLIRAECYARAGDKDNAMRTLNTLLAARWAKGAFAPLVAADARAALLLTLQERRKELLFRGLRWTDLRRLNQEDGLKTTLKRNVGGVAYSLPPGDPRYAFLIPQQVIVQTGMAQNPR
jgi:hypothetical protein